MRASLRDRRPLLSLLAAAAVTLSSLAVTVVAAPSASAAVADLRINEVESNDAGGGSDWIELTNLGLDPVDAGGLLLKDNGESNTLTIPAGTTIAPGAFVAFNTSGIGTNDSARLFDGATLVDSHSWGPHAATTYGRCPNGTGSFFTTVSVTKGAANDCGGIVFNEVESNSDPIGDFAEVVNTGPAPIDISGWKFTDSEPERVGHIYTVPAGTVVAAGGYFVFAEAAYGFGLGAPDGVRLLLADGTTLVDTYTWTQHATTSYGRCPNITGPIVTTTSSTRGAANDCTSPVRINEIESADGTPGDWVELINPGATPVDLSGFVVKDSGEPGYTFPAGTSVAAGGYLVVEEAQLGAGLDPVDTVRLFLPNGTTLLDSYSYTEPATTTYGRCPNGSGAFTTTQVATKGAVNNCPGDIVAGPWPGGADVATADPQNTFQSNLSGLMYEPSGTETPGTLWAVRNGPGALYKLVRNGATYAPVGGEWASGKLLHYPDGSGDVDAEGVTFTSAGPSAGIFVASERNNAANSVSRPSIQRYLPGTPGTELSATNDWNLSADLPGLGANLGLEAISWIPDSYLTGKGFLDANTAAPYAPSTYPNHGSGLFLVGVEQTGLVYAYALDLTSNAFTRVASFASGFPSVMELYFEQETQKLWVVCDDTCQGRSARFDVSNGVFKAVEYYERPGTMPNLNNEGFTLAPRAECVSGRKPAFWSDDSSTGGFAIRSGTVSCTERGTQTVAFTSTPPASPAIGATYAVTATGGASGNPVTFSTTTPSVCSVAGSQVSFTHAGTCTVKADQAGSDDFAAGTATQDVVVGKGAQTVTITSSVPAPAVIGATYTVTATGGASGNPVTFSTTTPSVCSVAGSTVTFDHAGTCTVRADQGGNDDYAAGSATQSIVVPKTAQAVTITSTAPTSPVVGTTYTVIATGGASGNPVVIGAQPSSVCTVASSEVTFVAPGTCSVLATQAGTADFVAGRDAQAVNVVKAATTTTIAFTPTQISAAVSVTAPGAAAVTGDVIFLVDGSFVGSAPVTGGIATLVHTIAPGATRTVYAAYAGNDKVLGSQSTRQRMDPTLLATLSSATPVSASGWYTSPVTVTWSCVPNGAAVISCPDPDELATSGADQSVTRTIDAEDGGSTTATAVADIDLDDPAVAVRGVVDGTTYYGDEPTPRCVGADVTSGIDTCVVSVVRTGLKVKVTATATDVAGRIARATATYRVPVLRVEGVRYTAVGQYVVERGAAFKLRALLGASPVPVVVGPVKGAAALPPATSSSKKLTAGAVVGGLTTWTGTTKVPASSSGTVWKVGVRVGGKLVTIDLKVTG